MTARPRPIPLEAERAQQCIRAIGSGQHPKPSPGDKVWIEPHYESPRDPEDFEIQTYDVMLGNQRVAGDFCAPTNAVAVARSLAQHLNCPLDLDGAYAWKISGPFGFERRGTLPEHLRPSL